MDKCGFGNFMKFERQVKKQLGEKDCLMYLRILDVLKKMEMYKRGGEQGKTQGNKPRSRARKRVS